MIYFVRHGECEANQQEVFAGQRNDSPLTDKGKQQAQTAGEDILKQQLQIDRIVSSPLSRATDTARIIAEVIDFDSSWIEIDFRLAEYDMGDLTGKPHQHLTAEQVISAPGAEDVYVFRDRVMAAIDELRKLPGNTLIVSHAGVGRVIDVSREGQDPRTFYDRAPYPNAQVNALQ